MPSTRRGNVQTAMAAILKKQGSIGGSASTYGPPKPRARIGTFGLDLALGGGFPIGSAVMFWGDPRSGKTTSCHRVAGALQKLCRRCLRPARGIQAVKPEGWSEGDRWEAEGTCDCVARGLSKMPDPPGRTGDETAKEYKERCEAWSEEFQENSYEELVVVWIDSEESYDSLWAERLGVDPRRVLLVRPSTAESVADAAKALIWGGGCDLLVVDSFAQLTPREEIEVSAEDAQRGLGARIINKMIRTLMAGMIDVRNSNSIAGIPHGMSQIWVNQVRSKIGITYGDPSVKPYGLGQDFATKAEIRFYAPELEVEGMKYVGQSSEAYKEVVRETIRMNVTKNTTVTGLRKLTTQYTQLCKPVDGRLAGDLDDSKYIYDLAFLHEAIVKKGKSGPYTIMGHPSDVKTQKELQELIATNYVVRIAVEQQIISRMTHK